MSPSLDLATAPLHIRAAALAIWMEWLADNRHSRNFTVSVSVRGAIAEVQGYNPSARARADGESGEVNYSEKNK